MKLDYLISIGLVKRMGIAPSKYIISTLDLNTGDIVESIMKQYDEQTFKQDIESFILDVYPNSKIMFENEDMWLTSFLKENFKDYLYQSENTIFGRRPYGWRPTKTIIDNFRENIIESKMCEISFGSLYYFYDKSKSMF